jgi:hypothetical protein
MEEGWKECEANISCGGTCKIMYKECGTGTTTQYVIDKPCSGQGNKQTEPNKCDINSLAREKAGGSPISGSSNRETEDIWSPKSSMNRKVHDYIQTALDQAKGSTIADIMDSASNYLLAQREVHSNCSDEMAAAEDYMFARSIVARHPVTYYSTLTVCAVYELVKASAYGLGLENLARTGKCPISKPSLWQLGWMSLGKDHGSDDSQRIVTPSRFLAPGMPKDMRIP